MEHTPYSAHSMGPASGDPAPQVMNVVVRDIQMSFGSMVVFIIKWVLASIPAMIILFILFAILAGLFGGLIAGMMNLKS